MPELHQVMQELANTVYMPQNTNKFILLYLFYTIPTDRTTKAVCHLTLFTISQSVGSSQVQVTLLSLSNSSVLQRNI